MANRTVFGRNNIEQGTYVPDQPSTGWIPMGYRLQKLNHEKR
jgi:hypothetical protein